MVTASVPELGVLPVVPGGREPRDAWQDPGEDGTELESLDEDNTPRMLGIENEGVHVFVHRDDGVTQRTEDSEEEEVGFHPAIPTSLDPPHLAALHLHPL